MNYRFFLAKRIYANGNIERQAAKPAIRIAMVGMALGLAIMLASICIVIGFKDEVRSKAIGFASHIQIIRNTFLLIIWSNWNKQITKFLHWYSHTNGV